MDKRDCSSTAHRIQAIASGSPEILLFVAAMAVGIGLRNWQARSTQSV
jgi:hypothetical protein